MNPTVELSFRYTERDYVRAVRAHHASPLRWWFDIAVAVVLAGIGGYFWRSPGYQSFGVVCIVLAAVFGLMLFAGFAILPPLAFRREPKFRDDYSLTFSPEGIHFRTAHLDSRLQWSMYSRALIDGDSYLLYYTKRQFTVIPKRVFESPEQQEAFEHLLTQHVPRIDRRSS